ncbi:MAG: hypothetical protein KatS3mg105_4047 [Gemmatales bacterium]|nr:MAG: hypothetical protein KatS3mg105_4047 [Gemmatales bacterium]
MVIDTLTISRLGQFVLAYLLANKGRATRSKLQKAVAPFLERRLEKRELEEHLEKAKNALADAGLVAWLPRGNVVLTERGQAEVLDFLGLEAPPKPCDWRTIKNRFLVAKAMGIPARSAETTSLGKKEGLQASILKKHFALKPEAKTLAQVLDLLVAQELGLELRPGENLLHPDRLRESLLTKWLSEDDNGRATTAAMPSVAPPPAEQPLDLETFAQRVWDAVHQCSTGWFGDNKVFISHVWRQIQDAGSLSGMTIDQFKNMLAKANQAGLVPLSRADLVQVMDPNDVRESETKYLNAIFHFIEVMR